MEYFATQAPRSALILFISIGIFDVGPEKVSGLWRNGPLVTFLLAEKVRSAGIEKSRTQVPFTFASSPLSESLEQASFLCK